MKHHKMTKKQIRKRLKKWAKWQKKKKEGKEANLMSHNNDHCWGQFCPKYPRSQEPFLIAFLCVFSLIWGDWILVDSKKK